MRRFAYACLGVLALALAFHLGARRAEPSGVPDCIEVAEIESQYYWTYVVDGRVKISQCDGNVVRLDAPLPRSGAIAAVTASSRCRGFGIYVATVLYRDGEVWECVDGAWAQLPSIEICGPVAVEPSTWGEIKARARQ